MDCILFNLLCFLFGVFFMGSFFILYGLFGKGGLDDE